MSEVVLETAKILGASTSKFWSQVHIFSPQEPKKLGQRGRLVAVLSLKKTGPEAEIVAFGRELILRLQEEYFGQLKGSILSRLKKAIDKVTGEVKGSFQSEVVAAVLTDKAVYLAILGGGRVILKRGEKLATVAYGKPNKLITASGFLKDQDFFFLGNSDFTQVAEGSLRAVLATDSIQEAVEALAPMVYSQSGLAPAAAALVKFRLKTEPEPVVLSQPEKLVKESPKPVEIKKKIQTRLASVSLPSALWQKISRGPRLLKNKLGRFWPKRTRQEPSLGKLRSEKRRPRFKPSLVIIISSGLLLLGSLYWGISKRQENKQEAVGQQRLAEARLKAEEGQALVELNPIRAQELLKEADLLLEEVDDETQAGEVLGLKTEVAEALKLALGQYELGSLTPFFDLEIIKSGGSGQRLVLSDKKLFVLDLSQEAIYEVDVASKKGRVVAGGESLSGAVDFTFFDQQLFVLTSKGILQKSLASGTEKIIIETDEVWSKIASLVIYNGNLYLLDSGRPGLDRYLVTEEGFGTRQDWLKEEAGFLSGATSLAINGSVWVTTESGEVLKLDRGRQASFSITGLEEPLVSSSLVVTGASQESLYVLDKDQRRLVAFSKEGEYQAQYEWNEPKRISSLVVSEEKGKVWLLSGSKIYEIELR